MLRDLAAFLVHKFRDPETPIDRNLFQSAIKRAMQGRTDLARRVADGLDLDPQGVIASIGFQLATAQ